VDVLWIGKNQTEGTVRRSHLKPLEQLHDYSCGQTCVAMLTGACYYDVVMYMGYSSTDPLKIQKGLQKFGLKSAKRLTQFRGNKEYPDYKKLDFDAVLKMVHRKGGSYHFVVWDAKRRRILDPNYPPFRIGRAHRITSYLRTWRS
jgi:hypothetical protein